VQAEGTHLSTSLHDLQTLHVDAIAAAGATHLTLDAGDLSSLSDSGLPQFDAAQSDAALDVTLRIDASQLDALESLATSLSAAGIDHFVVDQPLTSYDAGTQQQFADITAASGIDFVHEPGSSFTDAPLSGSVAATFAALEDFGTGGDVVVADGALSALAEAGMLRAYVADTLVLDGTTSGDTLLSTLREIADLGVDKVLVAHSDPDTPLLVDAGLLDTAGLQQVQDLFDNLDLNVQALGSIFEGQDSVALVIEQDVAHAIAQIDGGFEKLASLGFTELDVLMANTSAPVIDAGPLEVKLIGQNDDLYLKFHHS
jgi:hypothetical protein